MLTANLEQPPNGIICGSNFIKFCRILESTLHSVCTYLSTIMWFWTSTEVGRPSLIKFLVFQQVSIICIFWGTPGSKWTLPSDFLAKKKQLFFYEGLWPIVQSIKEGFLVLRSTTVLDS